MYNSNRDPRYLRYHLGKDNEHTVYRAEAVGLMLVAQLLLREMGLDLPINIFVNNQAAIKSSDVFSSKSGHDLIDRLIRAVRKKHSHRKQDINIHWVVGHKDVPGNTKADKEAKKAASSSNPRKCLLYYLQEDCLPLSVSALLQQ